MQVDDTFISQFAYIGLHENMETRINARAHATTKALGTLTTIANARPTKKLIGKGGELKSLLQRV